MAAFTLGVWYQSLFNFFAQDDFILLLQFSSGNIAQDFVNAFGKAEVTHWRPIHNLFFLISGNLFEKNYFLYHVLILSIHSASAFFVYLVTKRLFNQSLVALASAIFFVINPAHFVAMYWISGSAVNIGFLFFIISFYLFILKKYLPCFLFFILALLSSEAMLIGIAIYFLYWILNGKEKSKKIILWILSAVSAIFAFVKLFIFTLPVTYDFYRITLSKETLNTFKYYLTRIFGFAESSGDTVATFILVIWIILTFAFLLRTLNKSANKHDLIFPLGLVFFGLFPFVLIPGHLSAHYMVVSVWGISTIFALALKNKKMYIFLFLLLSFVLIAIYNVKLSEKNSWVTKRASLAKYHLERIEKEKVDEHTKIFFENDQLSTSEEAYVALGEGKALNFFFPDKNYSYCFSWLFDCSLQEKSLPKN